MINSPESMSFLFSGSLSRFLVLMAEISGRCSIPTTFPPGCTILAKTYLHELISCCGQRGGLRQSSTQIHSPHQEPLPPVSHTLPTQSPHSHAYVVQKSLVS